MRPLVLLCFVAGCARAAAPARPLDEPARLVVLPQASEPSVERAPEPGVGAAPEVAASDRALSPTEIAERTSPSVVTVRTEHGLGSGFCVALGVVATNLHVVAGEPRIVVLTRGGLSHDVQAVRAFDRAHDLALLVIDALGVPPLGLGDSDVVKVGAAIVAVGNPEGLESTVSTGVVSARRSTAAGSLLQVTAPVSPGSSGGPILDDRGAVIGITTFQAKLGQNLNFAFASRHLAQLLHAHAARLSVAEFAARTTRDPAPPAMSPASATH